MAGLGSLEDLFSDSGFAEGSAAKPDITPEGVPVEPLRRSGPVKDSDDSFITRVKIPEKESKPARESKGRSTANERRIGDLQVTLEEKLTQIFGLVSFGLPVTGVYGVENSDKAAAALCNIAKRRPAVLKALEGVADGVDALEIGRIAAGIAIAVQVDMGRIKPDAMVCSVLGVSAVVQAMEEAGNEEDINDNVMVMPVSNVKFNPVS